MLFLTLPVQMGLPQLITREIAKMQALQHWGLMREIWQWSKHFIIKFSAIVIVLTFIVLIGFEQGTSDNNMTIAIGLFLIPITALLALSDSTIRGFRATVLGQIAGNFLKPLAFFLLIGIFYWASESSLTTYHVMVLHVFASAIALILSLYILKIKWPQEVKSIHSKIHVTNEQSSTWLRATFPLALIASLQLINSYTDILMLGLLRSEAETGIYRIVVQMTNLIIFGLSAINLLLHPYFSRFYAQSDHKKLQQLVTTSARVILLIAIPFVLVFIFKGEQLLSFLFGEEYSAGYDALLILSIGQLANVGFGSVGALLNMTGHEKDTMRGMIIAALVNFFLNIILIPRYGMNGAALATAISFIIWNAMLWHLVKKRLGIESSAFYVNKRTKN
jgi:O-antigen/teichoic acid export membrane protein